MVADVVDPKTNKHNNNEQVKRVRWKFTPNPYGKGCVVSSFESGRCFSLFFFFGISSRRIGIISGVLYILFWTRTRRDMVEAWER